MPINCRNRVVLMLKRLTKQVREYGYSDCFGATACTCTTAQQSAAAEMGHHLATIDMGRKVGDCCAPFWGDRRRSEAEASDTAAACSEFRLLGVDISSELSLDHHGSCICAGCYNVYPHPDIVSCVVSGGRWTSTRWLYTSSRQRRCEFTDRLLQHCSCAPRTVFDKLQRVLNAAARVVTGTRKLDRGLGQIPHGERR